MTARAPAGAASPAGAFWTRPLVEVLAETRGSAGGLTSDEAARRLEAVGPNEPAPPPRLEGLREVGRALANPLILLLLAASAVAAAVGEAVSALLVACMVVLSVALNVAQAYRSGAAVRRLREQVAQVATAVRDGEPRRVPAREVVPGDVLLLAAGDLVPADARLLAARDLFVNEGALTGESLPSEKHAAAEGSGETSLAGAVTAVFRGSSVVSGFATAAVVRTGRATELGRVAARLAARPPETEFERGARSFGLLIARVVLFLVLVVFLANALERRDPLDSFLFAVAIAVGLTPELLPMIVSVTLASGAVRMARKQVVVKRLAAIESFGGLDVLCTDKTGTVTRGEIAVARHVDVHGEEDERVIELAAANSALHTGLKNPMDEAILRHAPREAQRYVRVDELPFDFSRRRVSVVVDGPEGRLLITKGAPEGILPLCTRVERRREVRALDERGRLEADARFRRLSADGYRVLAVAYRSIEPRGLYTTADEQALTLAGFATFLDPPVPGVAESIAALARDGVEVKVLTGDNELVTETICRQVGLGGGEVVLGGAIDGMTDPALAAVAERARIFARVSPVQKTRIVQALRSRGHVVGVVGDGINDAPALRAADVGISLADAVDVARETADIVLLDRRLAALHDGVVEGRRSFANVMKYVLMGTSSNFGNMVSMAGASLVLPFLPMLPAQILLNNLLYDLSQAAIPSDRVDPHDLMKPRRWNVGTIRRYMLVFGPISSAFDVLTFAIMLGLFHADAALFRTGWFVESLATQTLVVFVIRTAGRPWKSRPSPALAWSVCACAATGAAIPFTPLGPWLGFVPLPPLLFAVLAALVAAYLAVVEVAKRRLAARYGRQDRSGRAARGQAGQPCPTDAAGAGAGTRGCTGRSLASLLRSVDTWAASARAGRRAAPRRPDAARRQDMRVREWMQPMPRTAAPDMPIAEARRIMQAGGFRHLPVTEGGRLVGIVSDRDIRLPLPEGAREAALTAADEAMARLRVGDVMTSDVVTLEPDRPVEDAAKAMLHFRVGAIPVVEDERVLGIVTETDLLRAWVEG